MQAGLMFPAGHVTSMIAMTGTGFGSSTSTSPLGPGQQHQQHHQQMDFIHETAESDDLQNINEDFDNRSCSENVIDGMPGDDQGTSKHPNKKKRYHRHTGRQIQEMEAFFRQCPHPDDKQRKELSRELGLDPLQVKFWFQNKRTQTKNQHEKQENAQLRAENERLRAENLRYKEALSNASCPNCGGPASLGEMSFDEHHLRVENARLREEIDKISGIAAKYVGKPMVSYPLLSAGTAAPHMALDQVLNVQPGTMSDIFPSGDLLRSVVPHCETEKPMVVELAVAGMEELLRMAQIGEPLWIAGYEGFMETLNEEEYLQTFPRSFGPKPLGFTTEATRETAVVMMGIPNLVEILMDANRWSAVFSSVVSRAVTLEVFSTGVAGSYNGASQVMTAEYHLPSPLVPPRESLFVRYCKQHGEKTWAVVDVSLDCLRGTMTRCRRRPSGCLIQETPNGLTKVIWVEHVEVVDRSVHEIYKPLVNSGLAFGAKRWVATLNRQCERLASVMDNNIDLGMVTSQNSWKSMLKLAERMVKSYCDGVTSSPVREWSMVSGGSDNVRVTSRKSVDDPGRPPGIVLNAATSFWLPVPAKRLFEFLRSETSRNEWDILCNGGAIFEMAHIDIGRDEGNCVSLLGVNSVDNPNGSNMLILQENCIDATGAYVVYAPVDYGAMKIVMSGGDPDYVALLPSGFAIFPDGPYSIQGGGEGVTCAGCLLTISFQILVESQSNKLSLGSVATVNNLITCTVDKIKSALGV